MPTSLLWGTANPEGLRPDYNGVYLSSHDVTNMVEQINGTHQRGEKIPVHIEHKGVEVGRVVSALGEAKDGGPAIPRTTLYPVEKIAPRVIERKSVTTPLQTGLKAIAL